MAGFGSVSNRDGGRMGTSTRKPMAMGIQFVKSSETLNPQSESKSDYGGNQPETDSNSLLPKPTPLLSASSSPRGGGNGLSSFQPQFGGPAVNFRPNSDNHRSGPPPSRYNQGFVKSGENYSSLTGGMNSRQGYRMPGSSNLSRGGFSSNSPPVATFQKIAEAKPMCSSEQYHKAWKVEKDPMLNKLRKLAYEVVTLKSDRPNAKDKLHSAANRVPLRIEFNTQPVFGGKNSRSFLCYVFMEKISIASGQGSKIKDAKTNAYEAALQKVLYPYLRVVPTDPTSKELQVSKEPFTSPPPEPSKVTLHNPATDGPKEVASQHKESNLEAAGLKRRYNEYKQLDDFVIVEPKIPIPDCTPAHTLRRSADFNHMLLEYEYFFKGESARCILKIENEKLADVNGVSKVAAKNTASAQALLQLKKFCWIIKTKQAVDSNTKISKEEIVNELNEQSDAITNDNIGNKLLRKMGWSGGGVGKDGDGIAEPVSLKSVLNREGLGLSSSKGITDEFRRRIKEVIENYAASDNQEDLVFSCDFRLEERQIIHDECRRLNLRSKSKGKGQKRYLCVRRKRSVNQLFDHLMSVGGETARYQLVPPGSDMSTNADSFPSNPCRPVAETGTPGFLSSQSQSLLGNPTQWQSGGNFLPNNNGQNFGNSLSIENNDKMASACSGQFRNDVAGGNCSSGLIQNRASPNRFGSNNMGQRNNAATGALLQAPPPNLMGPTMQMGISQFGGTFQKDAGGNSQYQRGGVLQGQNATGNCLNTGGRMNDSSFGYNNNSNNSSTNNTNAVGGAFGGGGTGSWTPAENYEGNRGRMQQPHQQPNSMNQSDRSYGGSGSSGFVNSYNNGGGGMNHQGNVGGYSGSGGGYAPMMMPNEMGMMGRDGQQGSSSVMNSNPGGSSNMSRGDSLGNQGWNPQPSGQQWGMMGGQGNNGMGGGYGQSQSNNSHSYNNGSISNNNNSGQGGQLPNQRHYGGRWQ